MPSELSLAPDDERIGVVFPRKATTMPDREYSSLSKGDEEMPECSEEEFVEIMKERLSVAREIKIAVERLVALPDIANVAMNIGILKQLVYYVPPLIHNTLEVWLYYLTNKELGIEMEYYDTPTCTLKDHDGEIKDGVV